MSLPTLKPQPTRTLYVSAVILVSLFVMAFLWFALYAAMSPIQSAIASTMSQYDVANSTHANYTLAETFMTNLWAYFLVIFVFGLLYWVWIYSQRKGAMMGY